MPLLFSRKFRTFVLIGVAISGAVGFIVVRRALQEMRQLQSYTLLQTMRDAVELVPRNRRSIETLQSVVRSVVGGHDGWGNEVHVFVKEDFGAASYVLVSYGADGSPNVRNTEEYFSMASTDIRDDVRKDIVVRNGELVTFAGK